MKARRRADRRRDRGVRLRDGPVPHERPGRQRHQLAHPQAPLRRAARDKLFRALPTSSASSVASARRPAPAGTTTSPAIARPLPSPVVDELIAKHREAIGAAAAEDRRRGDRRPARLRARQRRREDSRREDRAARVGHRRRVPDGLWLPDPSRRADVLRGHGHALCSRAAHAASSRATRTATRSSGHRRRCSRGSAAEGGSFNAAAGGAR